MQATKFTSGAVCPRHDGAAGYGSCTVSNALPFCLPLIILLFFYFFTVHNNRVAAPGPRSG